MSRMAETVQDFFTNLPSRADTSKTAGMTNSYLFDIEGAGQWTVDVDNGSVTVSEGAKDADVTIAASQETFERIIAGEQNPTSEQSSLTAPMPGTVVKVLVEPGATVTARQPLVVLEAMKMETPLVSPYDAVVRAVHAAEGDRVGGGTLLVELEE